MKGSLKRRCSRKFEDLNEYIGKHSMTGLFMHFKLVFCRVLYQTLVPCSLTYNVRFLGKTYISIQSLVQVQKVGICRPWFVMAQIISQ